MKSFLAKTKQNLSINKAYFILYLLLTIVFIIGFGSIWIWKEFSDFNRDSEDLKIEHIEKQKQNLVHEVQHYVDFIDYQKSLFEYRTKEHLLNFVHQAHAIASNIYNTNKGKISDSEIKKQIKEAIRPLRFFNKKGYIFINTLSGKGVLYPLSREKEGADLLQLQDVNKNYVIKKEIDYVVAKDSVFIKYPNNYKIKNKYNAYAKISYLINFKPFNWYLGSYTYLDNFNGQVKHEAIKHFHDACNNSSNCVFVYHRDGTCIFHSNSDLIGKNIQNFSNETERKFAFEMLNQHLLVDSGFMNTDLIDDSKTIAYTHSIDEWDWIIGLSMNTQEIDKNIIAAKAKLKKKVSYYIFQIVLLVLIAITSIYFTIRLLAQKMNQNFISFNDFFKKATHSSNKINTEKLYFTEFKELASTINEMIDIRSIKEKELQIAIEKAEESDRLKSSFLANMSHEIRTPMNAIIGFSELLQQEDLPSETKHQFFNHIRNSGNSLLNLINDIIDFSKIESGELKVSKTYYSLNQLFDELYYTFDKIKDQKEKNHLELQFSKGLANSESVVHTDPLRLKQIITNLIDNAIKFTEEGGIYVSYELNQKDIIICVKDTGIGITREQQEIIFNRFRQADDSHARKYGGTGLGLSISKKLAYLLDGDLWVESIPQKGSVFHLKIPYTSQESTIVSISEPATITGIPSDLNNKKILVVDDYQVNSELIEQILEPTGAKLQIVDHGYDAIKTCETETFDVILLDLQMPEINGFEVLKRIKNDHPDVKIIAQTAFALANEKEQIMKSGFDGYISKPIIKDELLRLLSKTI